MPIKKKFNGSLDRVEADIIEDILARAIEQSSSYVRDDVTINSATVDGSGFEADIVVRNDDHYSNE